MSTEFSAQKLRNVLNGGVKKLFLRHKIIFLFLILKCMTGCPEEFTDESRVQNDYSPYVIF